MAKSSSKLAPEVKRKIQAADRQLQHLTDAQWSYSKRMLKFGMAAWVFGMSSFFSTITVLDLGLLGNTFSMWLPLLITALAAPIATTGFLVRKFSVRMKRLEILRRKLLAEYERAKLASVGKMIISS